MSVSIFWDNSQKTVLICELTGEMTVRDYYTIIDASFSMIDQLNQRVDLIIDRRAVTRNPSTVAAVLRYGEQNMPGNLNKIVIVGATWFTHTIVDLGRILTPRLMHEIHFAETVDEAQRQLAAQHTTAAQNA